jgi:hypothetical protein
MTGGAVALIFLPLVQVISAAMAIGLSALWPSIYLVTLVTGPVIFASVMAVNFTSAKSEAGDLTNLISKALDRPA